MEMNWIPFFDVILIVCLLLCLVRSWQRGFLLQLVDLFSWLVAAVLAYDMAREIWEVRSSAVETDGAMPGGRVPFASRNVRS